MEILLALVVSAVVLSVITSVYFSALQLRNRTARTFDEALPLQHALRVIQRDLASIMPNGGMFGGELRTTPASDASRSMNLFPGGQQVSPFLHTATGLIDDYTPFADVQRVAYYLVDSTNTLAEGRDLVRIVSRNLLPASVEEASSQWLMSGVERVAFQFYDGTTWLDAWDSTVSSNLPTAFKLQLVPVSVDNRQNDYLQAPVELVVPAITRSRAKTQDAGGGA